MKQTIIIIILAMLTNCTTIKHATKDRRDIKTLPVKTEISFKTKQTPSVGQPFLRVQVLANITEKETFERRMNIKRSLSKRGWLVSGGVGLSLVGAGVYEWLSGKIVLGRDLIAFGIGEFISSYFIADKELGEKWLADEKQLEPFSEPFRSGAITVSVDDFSWQVYSDREGFVELDLRNLALLADAGESLQIRFEATGETMQIPELVTVYSSVVSHYRSAGNVANSGIYKQPKFPPDLQISDFQFREDSGNDMLDSYESGEIRFLVNNQGRGEAQGLSVKLIALSQIDDIHYERTTSIGNVAQGAQKVIRIPISAGKNLPDGKATFRVEISEHFGFDVDPFSVSFDTRAFQKPILELVDVGIDDDKEGDSYGDNDGMIEPGESVEITAVVQNVGFGDAENVQAKVHLKGADVMYSSESDVFDLGVLKTGEVKKIKFAVMLNKRFKLNKLPISVSLHESKGEYGLSAQDLALNVGERLKSVTQINIAGKEVKQRDISRYQMAEIDIEQVPKLAKTMDEDDLCVIFGIEEYRYASDATFANRDATVFYQYAKDVFGVPERNIRIINNEDATKGEFEKTFSSNGWIARRTVPESDIFVYFAGHGAPDIKSKQGYLIPYDIDPNYASTGFNLGELYQNLSDLDVNSVTVILDACFTGQNREEEMLLADARPIFIELEGPASYEGLTVFTATSGANISSGYPEMKHGLFTYYFLKGLQGDADADKNNSLTVGELGDYLQKKVSRTAGMLDREQMPELHSTDEHRVLVKY